MRFSSVIEALEYYNNTTPRKICLYDATCGISYSDYFQKILRISYNLKRIINKGDYVVLKSSQTVNYLAAFHAIQLAGGITVPLEKNAKPDRCKEIADEVKAKVIIGMDLEDYDSLTIEMLDKKPEDLVSIEYTLPSADTTSEILFTTGTTGKSKGVIISHKNDVALAENVINGVEMKADNIEIIPMPLNHSFALRRYYANVVNGSTAVLLDGVVMNKRFFEALDHLNATAVAMAPSAVAILLKLTKEKLASYNGQIDYIQLGSSQLGEYEKEKLKELLPDARLYNIYGSSEAGCASALNFNSDRDKPFCIGKATCNSDIRFIDEEGNVITATQDSPGRIITGGPITMKGYFNEEELTRETLVDGFIHSNDMGFVDEDGYIFMTGRADDVIICGGNKIAPLEVEELCLKYEGIEECALVGKSDETFGEIPKLFVVVNDKFDRDELSKYLFANLEAFMVPKCIEILDSLPKTFNGKIIRKQLKEL